MGLYTFLFSKIKEMVIKKQVMHEKIKCGFVQRHSHLNKEMLASPTELEPIVFEIDANHIFFNFNGDQSIFCIEDYRNIDVDVQCVKILESVYEEFIDDVIDDPTSAWKFLLFDDKMNAIYEFGLISMQLLTNEEEAILNCSGCRKRYNK